MFDPERQLPLQQELTELIARLEALQAKALSAAALGERTQEIGAPRELRSISKEIEKLTDRLIRLKNPSSTPKRGKTAP